MRIEAGQGNDYFPLAEEPVMTILEKNERKSYYLCSSGSSYCQNDGICLEARTLKPDKHCMCKMPHYGYKCEFTHSQERIANMSPDSYRAIDRVLTGTGIAIVFIVLIGILILSWYLSWRRKKDLQNWTRNRSKPKSQSSVEKPHLSKEAIKKTTLEVAAASTGRRPSELMNEMKKERERAKMVTVATSPIRELLEEERDNRFSQKPESEITIPGEKKRYDSIYEASDRDQFFAALNEPNTYQYDTSTTPNPTKAQVIQNPHLQQYNTLQKQPPQKQHQQHSPQLVQQNYEMNQLTGYRNPVFVNNYPTHYNDDRIIYNEQRELVEHPLKAYDSQKNPPNQHYYPRKINNPDRMSGIYVNAKCLAQSPKATKAQFFDPQSMRKPFKIVSQQDALLNELLERSPQLSSHLNFDKKKETSIQSK